ncbi:HEPN domain-containing protein [Hugenholtzia roseola]|uniref:HEPN domain-containing protein n=1 Tax=Hugenholtzia roseola TaxID=1002 RepID=UPI0003FC4941|nr:HEPN domain-containing protein [Hugenholtzia roseola]
MEQAIETFKLNIDSVKQLDAIYLYLEASNVGKNLDLSEILRAEIVLAVSAMDNFISDLLLIGLVDNFEQRKPLSSEFAKFRLDMKTVVRIMEEPSQREKAAILGEYIRKFNEGNSYQEPKNIVSTLKLLGITDLWNKVSVIMEIRNPADVSKELENIVWNRNKIAHEADFNPLTLKKYPRVREDTVKAVEFIEKLCKAIYEIATS